MKTIAYFKTRYLVFIILCLFSFSGCDDEPIRPPYVKEVKTYSSEVAIRWMNMQVKQMREYPPTVGNVLYARHYAYSGIALYEAVVPGMPAYVSIASQLNGLTGLPRPEPNQDYHWAASGNAALAAINRALFPDASDENKTLMNQLEIDLQSKYANEVDAATLERSVAFGKAVANAVFQWAETDGYKKVNEPYIAPANMAGSNYWTPPNPMPVHTLQYFGNIRPLVIGSGDGADPGAPEYDKLPDMTMDVINSKPAEGSDEYNMAFWWRDFPGTSTPGHYVSILAQVLQMKQPNLDIAAHAYALGGITVMDITIATWQAKFKYLLARPFNYDDVMGESFTALLGAPHPEYPAAHASLSLANAEAMTSVFGDNVAFTDNTFDGLVTPHGITLAPRSYNSFREAGEEAGWSRLYGGIHFRKSIEVGFWQGKKVADNVRALLRFSKFEYARRPATPRTVTPADNF